MLLGIGAWPADDGFTRKFCERLRIGLTAHAGGDDGWWAGQPHRYLNVLWQRRKQQDRHVPDADCFVAVGMK